MGVYATGVAGTQAGGLRCCLVDVGQGGVVVPCLGEASLHFTKI